MGHRREARRDRARSHCISVVLPEVVLPVIAPIVHVEQPLLVVIAFTPARIVVTRRVVVQTPPHSVREGALPISNVEYVLVASTKVLDVHQAGLLAAHRACLWGLLPAGSARTGCVAVVLPRTTLAEAEVPTTIEDPSA